MACLSLGTWSCYGGPSASLSLLTGTKTRTSVSFNMAAVKAPLRSGLLHCSFVSSPSSLSFSSNSSFLGSSLGLILDSNFGEKLVKRRGLVVQAKKYRLCQTKRNRSRKSLARTHGFHKRMSTTSGRATIKRRRDKGRWELCPKSNPSSGKRV